jgi:malate dehydrogenase (oxaloacetate-decarboxylating)
MCLAAAHAIANTVSEEKLGSEWIIPSVFDKNVSSNVAEAVKAAALREGVSQGTGEYIPIVDQLRI